MTGVQTCALPISSSTSATVGAVSENTWYFFEVTPYSGSATSPVYGGSAYVQTFWNRKVSSPANLTATSGNSQTTLNWAVPNDAVGASIVGYQVQMRESGSNWFDVSSLTTSTTTNYVVAGLTNGATYDFRVAAITTNCIYNVSANDSGPCRGD